MERCRLCVEAEAYLSSPPMTSAEEEDSQLGAIDLALRRHRAEIDELLRQLERRHLSRRRA